MFQLHIALLHLVLSMLFFSTQMIQHHLLPHLSTLTQMLQPFAMLFFPFSFSCFQYCTTPQLLPFNLICTPPFHPFRCPPLLHLSLLSDRILYLSPPLLCIFSDLPGLSFAKVEWEIRKVTEEKTMWRGRR